MGGKLKIKLVEDGKGDIDEVYQELSEQYPNFFSDRLISDTENRLKYSFQSVFNAVAALHFRDDKVSIAKIRLVPITVSQLKCALHILIGDWYEPDMLLHKNNEIKTSKQRQKQIEAFAVFLYSEGTSLSSHMQKPSTKIENLRTRIYFPIKCGIVHKHML